MNRLLKIGPDGLVEFATDREMAHVTHCLDREATSEQSKNVKKEASTVDFASLNVRLARKVRQMMKSCPLCNCKVREDRLQTHIEMKCPSRPNHNSPPSPREKSTVSFSRKKSKISKRDVQLFVKCPQCGSEVASDLLIKHRAQTHGRMDQTLGKFKTPVLRNVGGANVTSVGEGSKKGKAAKHLGSTAKTAPGLARKEGEVEVERPAWWDNLDATKNCGYPAREEGRYGSYPSHDGFDDESKP